MTEVLRETIARCGVAYNAIEKATGVKRASIIRFMRGETSLRLDIADKLAEYFGLQLVKRKAR
jgi:plasmid maintenance system antidote protein VapI